MYLHITLVGQKKKKKHNQQLLLFLRLSVKTSTEGKAIHRMSEQMQEYLLQKELETQLPYLLLYY